MPSADSAPSLLSRLSPAVPLPGDFSSPSPAQPIAKSPTHRPTYLASPPAPSFLAGTPPKSSVSPRKGAGFSRSPHAPPHIPALPADVLSKAQPIPANRSTRSSRWAASPPSSPPLARSPLSFGNRAQASGISPNGNNLSSSTGKTPTASSPALDQIEAMLSQLRTTNPSSSPAKSPTIQSNFSQSPAPTIISHLTPSQPETQHESPAAAPANPYPPPPASVQSAQPEAPKKKVLGGRSKWARAGDDEPDEFASLAEKELHSGSKSKQEQEQKPVVPSVQGPIASVADKPTALARSPSVDTTAPPPVAESDSQADPPDQADPSFSASPQRRPSISSTSSSSASQSHHIDWADDDDDELPGLDDWGIETTPATYDVSTPSAPAIPSTSLPPSMPPLGARRRSTGRSQKSPPQPSPAPLPPVNRFTAPPSPTKGTPRTPRGPPAKPPARLFASARAAALATPPHLAASASTPTTPMALAPHAAQTEEGSWRDRKPRTPGGPGSALFSRAFSGISPAAGSPPTPVAAPVSPATEAASKGRRSRGGKARNKGGAGGAAGGGKAGGAGAGAGAQASKWA
ncbi:hypothetical protein NBRC10512_004923 [Rhodotorula toruloides]|uniref:RHTO0S01e12838g1_1 n=2 Tax=Rhodotorula toruloides TaxID=5286 RepID=A0A061AEQ2_RHOTO|nr:uncharacterized protein RHTO_04688 [Rhodotorula toruloides NP11]EMS24509.1 hypothetical protein RHTO_04688 [Rhodotorula toruloides NP11]CDR36039.1 RHTO0S01e12838g1_1 [Rhodotorula toruloides]